MLRGPTPTHCGQRHICPVCAPRRSRDLARLLRDAIPLVAADCGLALATLTHTDDADETLGQALGRWLAAWSKTHRGRAHKEFNRYFAGYYRGMEATRGQHNRWWHVHGHILLVLRPGVAEDEAMRWLGQRWREASESVRPGWGWNPHAGGCTMDLPPLRIRGTDSLEHLDVRALRCLVANHGLVIPHYRSMRRAELVPAVQEAAARWNATLDQRGDHYREVVSWSGDWWRSIDPDEPDQIYQASKYPTPAVRLDAERLVEFLTYARGRRWHQGGGCLLRTRQLRDLVQAQREQTGDSDPLDHIDYVSLAGPGRTPNLDEVAPDLGWDDGRASPLSPAQLLGWVRWTVSSRYCHGSDWVDPTLRDAVEMVGGRLVLQDYKGEWLLLLPRAHVAEMVRWVHGKMALMKKKTDQKRKKSAYRLATLL